MKKILSFLFPVVALLCLASCSDDDDLPNVDFNIAFENAVQVDGKIYVAVGQDLNVSSITVINKECPVYADDKSPATAVVSMPVEVVATPEDLPSDGEATFVVHPSTSERNK